LVTTLSKRRTLGMSSIIMEHIEIYTFTFKDRTLFETGQGWRHEWDFSPDGMSATMKREIEKDGTWWTAIEAKGVKTQAKGLLLE